MIALILNFWPPDLERRHFSCHKPTIPCRKGIQIRCLKPGLQEPRLAYMPWADGSVFVSLSFQELRSRCQTHVDIVGIT